MCECLEYDDGSMYLCEVCAPAWHEHEKETRKLVIEADAANAVVESLHDKGWPVDKCTCDTCELLRKLQGGESNES